MDAVRIGIVAAFLLGAVAALSGVAHWVAVTTKAVAEDRGYDVRLADMLAIGFLPVTAGAVMLLGAWRGGAGGLRLAGTASALLAILLIVLWPALTTGPEGSKPGTAVGLAAFAAEAVLAWWAT